MCNISTDLVADLYTIVWGRYCKSYWHDTFFIKNTQ